MTAEIPSTQHPSLYHQAAGEIVSRLTGRADPEQARTDELRRQCREEGNPFPLVAHQWPSLVARGPDKGYFRVDPDDPKLTRITDGMRRAILDPRNPVLRLDVWQQIILAGFFDVAVGELAIKGNTGAGKGTATSLGFNLWFDVYAESRTTLTSETYDHAIANIFGEVREWRRKMAHPGSGRMLSTGIADGPRHYIAVRNPKPQGGGEAFSGAHGPNTIYGFDEATASPDNLFDNAEKNARKLVALANPRTLAGRFRNMFEALGNEPDVIAVVPGNLGLRLCVTVGGLDCMNVRHRRLKQPVAPPQGIEIGGRRYRAGERLEPEHHKRVRPLIPNQIDLAQFQSILKKKDPRHVDIFAHGKFPTEDPELQVILSSWLPRHEQAWAPGLVAVEAFGFDVARSVDGDESVLAAGSLDGLAELHARQYSDVVEAAQWVIDTAREQHGIDLTFGRNPVCVDTDGLGAGAADYLKERGVWVIEFRGNATSGVDPRKYGNLRTEAYAELGRRLDPREFWGEQPWPLPPDRRLREELVAPQKVYSRDGIRFTLTPKAELKSAEYLGRSPDRGDGAVYLYHAIRELHNLDRLVQDYRRTLVTYPNADTAAERGDPLSAILDRQRREREAVEQQPAAAEPGQSPDRSLLTWLEERYGGAVRRGESGRRMMGFEDAEDDGGDDADKDWWR